MAVATTGLADLARSIGGDGAVGTLGPGVPIQPFHQDEVEPRRWAYRAGYNVQQQPRAGESITFEMLRSLGRNYDIANLARQKRIDGIKTLSWNIGPVPVEGMTRADKKARTAKLAGQINDATGFWSTPNQEDPFPVWINQYLDDLWTTDAATLYIRKTKGGDVYGIETPDGTTFRPIIDLYGRIPLPPEPAYGQVIFGMTWTMFTRDEIIYQPYWQTTDSPYGHPPIEWIILAINRALRRQTMDLSYYTEGTLPVAFLRVAKDTPAADLKDLRETLDEMLSGNDLARSRVIPIPGGDGTGLDRIVPEPLNAVEEWLMHLTCAAHGVIPTELGFQQRGVGLGGAGFAQSAADVSNRREAALAHHLERIFTGIIQGPCGWPDLQFNFEGLEQTDDSLVRAQTTQIYVNMGARSVDDVAENDLDIDPPGLGNYVMTTAGPELVADILAPPEPVVMTPQGPSSVPGQMTPDDKQGPAEGTPNPTDARDAAMTSKTTMGKLAKAGASESPLPVSGRASSFGPSSGDASGTWDPPSSRGSLSGRRPYP